MTETKLTFMAAIHSIETGEEDRLATFYIMNTGRNRASWGVTDEALEHAIPQLLGKPIGCGEGYREGHFAEVQDLGRFITVNKPNGYALATAEITDDQAWELLTSDAIPDNEKWGPISVVVDGFEAKCSVCGKDINAERFEHDHIKDGSGYIIIGSFKFLRVDFVHDPAYPQAGILNFGGDPPVTEVPITLLAEYYAGTSQSNGGNPGGTGSGSRDLGLTPEEKRKKIALENQINDLTAQVKTLTDDLKDVTGKLTAVEAENATLKTSIDAMITGAHAEKVARALAARKLVGIGGDEDETFLSALPDGAIDVLTLEAVAMAERLKKTIVPKAGKPQGEDLTKLEAAIAAQRKSMFGHEDSLLKVEAA